MNFHFAIRFLGVGNSHALELGTSSCVLEQNHQPLLLIDCGLSTLITYTRTYSNSLPSAIFITHTHLDHIGGLENLFYQSYFGENYTKKIKLLVPVKLVEILHKRMADYPSILAEGGVNFWDNFQLIPVSEHFWYQNIYFTVFPVRHHEFHSAYGISLEGVFLFTGDTRPIPEIINKFACRNELIFHDICISSNPSHTGIYEVKDHYKIEQLQRMVFYHYESEDASNLIEQLGFRVARCDQVFPLQNTGSTMDN
jgi:ribonuclease BN (tRNA processing enzyme)